MRVILDTNVLAAAPPATSAAPTEGLAKITGLHGDNNRQKYRCRVFLDLQKPPVLTLGILPVFLRKLGNTASSSTAEPKKTSGRRGLMPAVILKLTNSRGALFPNGAANLGA